MAKLEIGQKAPDFRLLDQNDKRVRLADFKGRKLLLYFYPRADTPGCTKQSCSVSEALPKLSGLKIHAVGISPDEPKSLKKFDEKYGLNFPLLSDADHAVADAYGVWGTKTSFGQQKQGIIRSAFLLDESGKVLRAWYRVKPEDTVPNVLSEIRESG
ncbi:MAG: thioredoxin-dependent thiol peroxidase [Deltaproteobacteria bacterium]|nr:thioredoxin-dependent thiol peroxidase [Deltaproteobacteria bacterium]